MAISDITNVILESIVGSQAYGLAHEGSDVDIMGIFAVDTQELHGLRRPEETKTTTSPDSVYHEVAKYCRLALSCNPTVLELLWLDDYTKMSGLGAQLIMLRQNFLSKKLVMNSYLGYANQQFIKLKNRGDGKFDSDTGSRTLKHARHLIRLVDQGLGLFVSGEVHVKVADPEGLRELAADFVRRPEYAEVHISKAKEKMLTANSPLPEQNNPVPIENWLKTVRSHYYFEDFN
jgi:uncharacterized protein